MDLRRSNPVISYVPHQPISFAFLQRSFGKKKSFVGHSMRAGLKNGDGSIILRTVIALFVSAESKQLKKV